MYDELLDAWALPRPRVLSRAQWGISNESWFVQSEAGEHVLRLYVHKRPEAIRFEHEVLRRLATAELTFRTPNPLETEAGNTLAIDVDSARPAALFRRIEGEHLDDDDAAGVAAAAAAFAALDNALADIDRTDVAAPTFSGDLRSVHRAISDLGQVEEVAGLAARSLAEAAAELAPALCASLPSQLIHGDFAFGNVLVRAGRVRGVLDFEYVGRNVRALELGGALRIVLTKGYRERLWRPVLNGYLRTLSLDPSEIAALPALVVLQAAIVLVWWSGRAIEGHSTPEVLREHVDRALSVRDWTAANGTQLLAEALRASSRQPSADI
ncbi:MAG: phosphotransferase enzyme family protein [Candidatus Limnocylindria bacterium]